MLRYQVGDYQMAHEFAHRHRSLGCELITLISTIWLTLFETVLHGLMNGLWKLALLDV